MTAVCDSEYHAPPIDRLSGQDDSDDSDGSQQPAIRASSPSHSFRVALSESPDPSRPLGALSVSVRPHLVTVPRPDDASPRDEGRKREAAAAAEGERSETLNAEPLPIENNGDASPRDEGQKRKGDGGGVRERGRRRRRRRVVGGGWWWGVKSLACLVTRRRLAGA